MIDNTDLQQRKACRSFNAIHLETNWVKYSLYTVYHDADLYILHVKHFRFSDIIKNEKFCMSVKKVTYYIIYHFSDKKYNEVSQGLSAETDVSRTVRVSRRTVADFL